MISGPQLLLAAILIGGSLVGYAVSYIAWQHRDHPAAKPLTVISAIPGVAGFCYAMLVLRPTLFARPLLAVANWLIVVGPAYFLFFTIMYTGRSRWLTQRRRRIILGVFVILATVNSLEPLFLSVEIRTIGGLALPVFEENTQLRVLTALAAYSVTVVGFGLLGKFLLSPRNMYRKQTALIILGILVTVVGNVVSRAGFSPHPGLNLTVVFFVCQAAVITLALFRYEFLNIEPLAPEIVLEEIDDPVLILDDENVVVDTNPAGKDVLEGSDPVGVPVEDAVPGLCSALSDGREFVVGGKDLRSGGGDGSLAVYDLNETPIRDQYDRNRGTVIVFREITLLKQRERTLESLQAVSRDFLRADTAEEVLDIAVRAVEEVLDYSYAGAMYYDADADLLRPTAFTDTLAAAFEDADGISDPVVEPGQGDVGEVFVSGEPMIGDPLEAGASEELPIAIGGSMLFPLGDHGILGISAAKDHDGFSADDRRFGEILAKTTENALDRVEKEAQLRENRELLAERNEQIEFFNSVLRHDLMNGLAVISGHTEMLAEQVDGETQEHVETIDEWTSDIMDLTETVRSVTRTVTGDRDVELHSVNLTEAIEETVEKLTAGFDVAVDIHVPEELHVQADELVSSVLDNVLHNAVEHNDAENPKILVHARQREDRIEVRIADNGPGIPEEMEETVFEKSVTSERSGSIGFGLYFVGVMMDVYGGEAWFEDRAETPVDSSPATDSSRGAVAVLSFPTATVPQESAVADGGDS